MNSVNYPIRISPILPTAAGEAMIVIANIFS